MIGVTDKMFKRIIAIVLSLVLISTFAACGTEKLSARTQFNQNVVSKKLTDNTVVAENDKFKLIWTSKNCSVSLIEKSTGNVWGITPNSNDEPSVDALGMPIKKHAEVESAVLVEYVNPETNLTETALSYTSAVSKGMVIATIVDGGVYVEYYFKDIEVMIPVSYLLRNDSIVITMDTKKIQESSRKVVSVSFAPFWCSAENDAKDSYLFYPSGSGALIYPKTLSASGQKYAAQVFGKDPTMYLDDKVTNDVSVKLPVFGAKFQNNATCAIIESGTESAEIVADVGSSSKKYSSVYVRFMVRGYRNNMIRYMSGVKKELDIYTSNMIDENYIVGFYPLTGEDANYSGMANKYKEYLKSQNFLTDESKQKPLSLTMIGGLMSNKSFLGIPYRSLSSATTIKDALDIVSSVSKQTNQGSNIKLLGFGKTGLDNEIYANGFSINNKLGSIPELSDLNDYCLKNDINLYFDFDIIKFKKSSLGYNTIFDSSYNALGKIAEVYEYSAVTRSKITDSKMYLLKRSKISPSADKLFSKINKWEIAGLSFDSFSSIAYSDYSDKKTTKYNVKTQMTKQVSDVLDRVSTKYRIAGNSSNSYFAVLSDMIFESPLASSKEQIFSEDIPFYQMVFKGYVSFSGEPINTAKNWKTAFLKSIESGSSLEYTIIRNYRSDFVNYKGTKLYPSVFADIEEKIYADYEMAKDFFSATGSSEIIKHSILENGLREIVYKNGTIVYLNYSENVLQSPLGEVKGLGFIMGDLIYEEK